MVVIRSWQRERFLSTDGRGMRRVIWGIRTGITCATAFNMVIT